MEMLGAGAALESYDDFAEATGQHVAYGGWFIGVTAQANPTGNVSAGDNSVVQDGQGSGTTNQSMPPAATRAVGAFLDYVVASIMAPLPDTWESAAQTDADEVNALADIDLFVGRLLGKMYGNSDAPLAGGFAGATEDVMTLYRAVSTAEHADIQASGLLRAAPGYFETGKWFAESGADATQWGNTFYGPGNFQVIAVQFGSSTAGQFIRLGSLDGIGPARFGTFDQIGNPPIQLWTGP